MEINKQTIEQFRKDFADQVKALENKYGVDIDIGAITFGPNSFHGSLTVRNYGLDIDEWNWHCARYGFKPEDLGRMFWYKRNQYKITGIKVGS